ncbi:MAG: hypothetical protein R2838_18075 [Caldilineaceae bacterium]
MAQRSPDPGLTQIGKRQAEMVARHLAADGHPESRNGTPLASTRAGYGIQTLYVGAMLRALQTLGPSPPRRVGPAGHGRHPANTAASSWATRAAKPILCALTPG